MVQNNQLNFYGKDKTIVVFTFFHVVTMILWTKIDFYVLSKHYMKFGYDVVHSHFYFFYYHGSFV